MIKIGKIILSVCATNCYFIYDENDKRAIVIDPSDEGQLIYQKLKAEGIEVEAIFLTHGHFDHIGGGNKLRELSGAKVYAMEEEEKLLLNSDLNLSKQFGNECTLHPDILVREGQVLNCAGISCEVIKTPGHTAGGCSYYFEQEEFIVSGDTLFEESIGRTDFPTSSYYDLIRSIKEKLFALPDNTKVFPGHGEATSIGHEKKYNPFCQ